MSELIRKNHLVRLRHNPAWVGKVRTLEGDQGIVSRCIPVGDGVFDVSELSSRIPIDLLELVPGANEEAMTSSTRMLIA